MSTISDGGRQIMPDTASKMPARIWAENTPDYGAWFDHRRDVDDVRYIRSDIVERLVEALGDLVQRFDTFDGQPFINPPDSLWAMVRSTLAAYRESISDKA